MSTARPVVSVFDHEKGEKKSTQVKMPIVCTSPLRPDLIRFVHTNMAKNKRQAQGVKFEAGYDTAAISWGTGRAVARIPRVPGGGTHRSGQGAFGNMCRGGGMFAPLKTWRKWHRKVNTVQKRHAVASALAASSLPSLVLARGHRISDVPELPLVVDNGMQNITKTKQALNVLKALGCEEELEKVNHSKKLRCGRGKLRNRRYTMRRGPLVIYNEDNGCSKAFRNLPGVDTCNVNRLNLLQVAPGGNFGRFIIWTESAFKQLNSLFGTYKGSSLVKKNYHLPRAMMTNADLDRIINSEEVQQVVRPALEGPLNYAQKKNPLTNKGVRARLFPGINTKKRSRTNMQTKGTREYEQVQAKKKARLAEGKKVHSRSKAFYKNMEAAYAPKEKPKNEE